MNLLETSGINDSPPPLSRTNSRKARLFGYDNEFAEKIQAVWREKPELKTALQNELDTLYSRSCFSLFAEGAQNDEEPYGLQTAILQMTTGAISVAFGVNTWVSILSNAPNHPTRNNGIPLMGLFYIGAGLGVSYSIFNHHWDEGQKAQIASIVQKTLGNSLSVEECSTLSRVINKAFELNESDRINIDTFLPSWSCKVQNSRIPSRAVKG